ncbi:MAG: molybdenum cofactor synthesis domain-containing protein [Bacteroidales bacterium]|jgi:molybdenum cofactor synthesis domain-containing protein|nr:molybdenum cofactor synthesis domain-containing protein [Bacteroidales bacterium]
MSKGKVLSVNLSAERGIKKPVTELILTPIGIQGDVHAGHWNRQVSLIDRSHIQRFKNITDARDTAFGEFAENITVEGLHEIDFQTFDLLKIGNVTLEVTRVGKPFHDEFRELGNYVMPRVGVFCRVKNPGTIRAGDPIEVIPKVFKNLIITLSDRAAAGEYEDLSGPEVLNQLGHYWKKKNVRYQMEHKIIPDDSRQLQKILLEARENAYDVVITTGGTGIGKRDITVETVEPLLDKMIPGVMEMIRMKYGQEKPNALLSRGVAGVMKDSLVYTLPGSVKAVKEYMNELLKTMQHLIYMLHGIDAH